MQTIRPLYHGTNAKFNHFDLNKVKIKNDNYGGPVYLADDFNVAKNYAKAAAKSGGDRIVMELGLRTAKLFYTRHVFTHKELTQFYKASDVEDFARGSGLLSLGADKYAVIQSLEDGTAFISGDAVFKGLSRGNVNTLKARKKLQQLGYDALCYEFKGTMVFCPYRSENIVTLKHFIIGQNGDYKLAA